MSKRAFDRIAEGLDAAVATARGEADPATFRVHVPRKIDVRGIRRGLGLSQPEFAARFGFSVHTVRKWEQEGRQPEGPARAYLRVIERTPQAVINALDARNEGGE